jgi:hypothetical protein
MPTFPSLPAPLDLAGDWTVVLDREDRGIGERWFARPLEGATVRLPGCLAEHGLGDPVTVGTAWTGSLFDKAWFTEARYAAYRDPDNVKVPFFLQPEHYYAGLAWYQREVELPVSDEAVDWVLSLERAHWATRVWVDEIELGEDDSLSTPHLHALPRGLGPGLHRLTVRVDNTRLRVDLGENSHSLTDHTQGNWNGLIGALRLVPEASRRVLEWTLRADGRSRAVSVAGRVTAGVGTVSLEVRRAGADEVLGAAAPEVDPEGRFSATLALGPEAARWDEFSPFLHELALIVPGGATARRVFGLRDLRTEGTGLFLNDRPLFVRGTLECALHPRTGYPPTDGASWRWILGVARDHGLNTLRFHSWCPPEAAFAAADAMGIYLQIEVASWPMWSTKLGEGRPVDTWLEAETGRILAAYGHHPSFCFFAAGNEPDGDGHPAWLGAWVERWRARDPGRLYSAGAGWPIRAESDFHIDWHPRLQHWGAGLDSPINAHPPATDFDYRETIAALGAPNVTHEIGQWCAYPDLSEISSYTGYLKARNFEIFRERLEAKGLGALAPDFLRASGRLQVLCYKAEIEAQLRTPGLAGFHLLGLQDFSGQGTALVGVLNAFWESKGYLEAAEFASFCCPVVPLARMAARVYPQSGTIEAGLEVAHWTEAPARAVEAEWRVRDGAGRVLLSGPLPPRDLPVGGPWELGRLSLPLAGFAAPARYVLELALPGLGAANGWDFWVYPESGDAGSAEGLLVTDEIEAALTALGRGGRVLLAVGRERIAGAVQLGFSSIFWNTAWTNGQAPHTLGILCDPAHPALADFPTDFHSDWQWWHPLRRGGAFVLDELPSTLAPIVRVIDDWFDPRRLGLILEARVGSGRLLLCGVDLLAADDPACRQLLVSLRRYATGEAFAPGGELSASELRSLLVS